MRTKHMFALIHIRNKGEVATIKLVKPPVKIVLTDRSKAVLLLWIFFVIYISCLSCFLVCSLQPCGHLLGKGWTLGYFVCDVFLCFVTFSCGDLGQVWYFIVSVSDLCHLSYFFTKRGCSLSVISFNLNLHV